MKKQKHTKGTQFLIGWLILSMLFLAVLGIFQMWQIMFEIFKWVFNVG